MLALMGKGLLVERLHHNLKLLFKQFSVGVRVQQRSTKCLDLAGVVASANTEDDPSSSEDIGHCEIFSNSDWVPHG